MHFIEEKKMKKSLLVLFMVGIAIMVFAGGQQAGRQAAQNSSDNQILDLSTRGSISVISRGLVAAKNKNAVFDAYSRKFNMDIDWDVRPSGN